MYLLLLVMLLFISAFSDAATTHTHGARDQAFALPWIMNHSGQQCVIWIISIRKILIEN